MEREREDRDRKKECERVSSEVTRRVSVMDGQWRVFALFPPSIPPHYFWLSPDAPPPLSAPCLASFTISPSHPSLSLSLSLALSLLLSLFDFSFLTACYSSMVCVYVYTEALTDLSFLTFISRY